MKNRQKSIWNYVKENTFNGLFFRNLGYIIVVVILPMLFVVDNIITELLSMLETYAIDKNNLTVYCSIDEKLYRICFD